MDDPDGTGHPTTLGDRTASLCPTCGNCRITVGLDGSQLTQISTKLRETTSAGQQPTGHPGGDRPAPPPPPAAAKSTDAIRDAMRTIGLRLQRIRVSRNKSLRVIAGLAGMSRSTLHRIEHGQRELTLSEIV
ncbi:MAG: helix-turn-helix domain-containing protein, partial [Pseudonocardiaceae bacterium]